MPDPSPEVLGTWASLFHVSTPVLQYAIQVVLPSRFPPVPQITTQLQPDKKSTTHNPPPKTHSQRLPTPADSLTPEPTPTDQRLHHRGSPDYFKTEVHSPMLASFHTASAEPFVVSQHQNPGYQVGTHDLRPPLPGSGSVPVSVDQCALSQVSCWIFIFFCILDCI